MSISAEAIRRWLDRPDVMVRELFSVTPDAWQDEVLQAFPNRQRIAMKASVGPGKSCVMAWLAWNFLLTRAHCNVAATSISADNLKDGLWKEMAFWQRKSPLLMDQFEINAERIFHKGDKDTWFLSARNWPKSASVEQLGATLAGLHADHILFLLDEAGSMPVAIAARADAALSSAKDGHIVMAGNTNTLEGALYHACVRQAHLWHVTVINGDPDNPNRSPRISEDWAREVIQSYGRDDPFVKVMVLGEWPVASLNSLIGADEIEDAMKRVYRDEDVERSPRVLGVDVARSALGDKSVIFPRQGLVAFKPWSRRGVNSVQGAAQVSRTWTDWDVNACFVDNSGGFGAGWIDQLQLLNRTPIGIGFNERPLDPARYYNRRAEMYFTGIQWIKNGGALPPECRELVSELPAMTYTFKGDRLLLEDKALVAARIGHSPDDSDGFALTFAAPVAPRAIGPVIPRKAESADYDPFVRFLQ